MSLSRQLAPEAIFQEFLVYFPQKTVEIIGLISVVWKIIISPHLLTVPSVVQTSGGTALYHRCEDKL